MSSRVRPGTPDPFAGMQTVCARFAMLRARQSAAEGTCEPLTLRRHCESQGHGGEAISLHTPLRCRLFHRGRSIYRFFRDRMLFLRRG
jgi:hypothetical protein